VRDWINGRLRRVRIVEAVQCDVPLEILLSVGRFDAQQLAQSSNGQHQDHESDHGQDFSTWSYETDQPLSMDVLGEMIRRKLPGNIYRCKGIIFTKEAPDQRAILQVVGRRADIALGEAWGDVRPRTQIVAIGAIGSIDPRELTALFETCISERTTTATAEK